MVAEEFDENPHASRKLSELWTQVLDELDTKEIRRADGFSVEGLGDIAETIVTGVLAVDRFSDNAPGIARSETVVGARFPALSSRILVLERAVEELAEEELRAVLVHEFFHGLLVYLDGPERVLELPKAELDEEVEELMRESGFEAEADLIECLRREWPLDARRRG